MRGWRWCLALGWPGATVSLVRSSGKPRASVAVASEGTCCVSGVVVSEGRAFQPRLPASTWSTCLLSQPSLVECRAQRLTEPGSRGKGLDLSEGVGWAAVFT